MNPTGGIILKSAIVTMLLVSCGGQTTSQSAALPTAPSGSQVVPGPSSAPISLPRPIVGTPFEVTGEHVGDVPGASGQKPALPVADGDVSKVPEWTGVVKDGVVVGYVHFDLKVFSASLPVDQRLKAVQEMRTVIYDEAGQPVGRFVDGLPVIDTKTGG